MKKHFFSTVLTAAAALLTVSASAGEKNVADVEFRTLPPDFENLPARESAKWNFGFRPYGKESSDFLWSDPNLIRDVTSGGKADEKKLPTGIYVSCDEYEISFLVYGAMRSSAEKLAAGQQQEELLLECFFIPGDTDDPQIINYQHFGISSRYPAVPRWKISWMKDDRNVRDFMDDMIIVPRPNANGMVIKFSVPWVKYWDHLPIFSDKENNNIWRLSVIRWGGSSGGETWGGNVHAQSKCGYIRMPEFTDAQASLMMKTTLLKLWDLYQKNKSYVRIAPDKVSAKPNYYRQSISHLPHSWMNLNEDREFVDTVLIPLIAKYDGIGKGLAEFDKMSLAEQKAFYLENAPRLGNFHYDVDEAYGAFIKNKLMKP